MSINPEQPKFIFGYSRFAMVAAALATGFAISGCAKINEAGLGLVTTKVDAYAIVNAQLLTGNVYLVPDRTGRLVLGTDPDAASSCAGALRYTAVNAGLIDLHCGDGTLTKLDFNLVSESMGYAYGISGNQPISLVFGVSEQDAPAYLRPPAGQSVSVKVPDGGLQLK